MNNPFTLSFGKKPKLIINDIDQYEEIKENFLFENQVSSTYLITGVRGTGVGGTGHPGHSLV